MNPLTYGTFSGYANEHMIDDMVFFEDRDSPGIIASVRPARLPRHIQHNAHRKQAQAVDDREPQALQRVRESLQRTVPPSNSTPANAPPDDEVDVVVLSTFQRPPPPSLTVQAADAAADSGSKAAASTAATAARSATVPARPTPREWLMAAGWATTANEIVEYLLEECVAQIAAAGQLDTSSRSDCIQDSSVNRDVGVDAFGRRGHSLPPKAGVQWQSWKRAGGLRHMQRQRDACGTHTTVQKQARKDSELLKIRPLAKKERKPYLINTRPRKRGEYTCGKCGFFPKATPHSCIDGKATGAKAAQTAEDAPLLIKTRQKKAPGGGSTLAGAAVSAVTAVVAESRYSARVRKRNQNTPKHYATGYTASGHTHRFLQNPESVQVTSAKRQHLQHQQEQHTGPTPGWTTNALRDGASVQVHRNKRKKVDGAYSSVNMIDARVNTPNTPLQFPRQVVQPYAHNAACNGTQSW